MFRSRFTARIEFVNFSIKSHDSHVLAIQPHYLCCKLYSLVYKCLCFNDYSWTCIHTGLENGACMGLLAIVSCQN